MSRPHAPYKTANAEEMFRGLVARHLRPPPVLTVSEWADKYRFLNSKTSSEPGRWRTSRTPYLREPMDALSALSTYERVVLMTGTQIGKTETLGNFLAYAISYDPAPVMVVQPTSTLSKRWSQQRLLPLIESTPVVAEAMTANISRDESQSQLLKTFKGGVLVVAGANSASDLRSMPVQYLLLDEVDAYPLDTDGEGDPIELAARRTDTFTRKRILMTSTPTVEGFSRIEQAYKDSTQSQYFVPCPHCDEYQTLDFKQLKWDKPELTNVRYVCVHCGAEFDESHKPEMLERGEWRARMPHSKNAGFQLNGLYSPLGWLSWGQIVREFVAAKEAADKGDVSRLKVWVNTRLAEVWKEKGDEMEAHALQRRSENYPLRVVPDRVVVVTASVDVQGDRLEVLLVGWGRGEESWVLDHNVFYGDPSQGAVWSDLDEYLKTPLGRASGTDVAISACAIDSGGHHTHQVYLFCAARRSRHIFAVKGQSQSDKPILGKPTWQDINHRGTRVKNGAQLFPVGSDTAKSLVYGRLRVASAGPGYVHLSKELPNDFFEQLTSERLVTKFVKGRARLEWVKAPGVRNEALDLMVYATAAAVYLGISRWKDADWNRLDTAPKQEHNEISTSKPLVEEAPKQPLSVAPQVQQRPTFRNPRMKGGWVSGWK